VEHSNKPRDLILIKFKVKSPVIALMLALPGLSGCGSLLVQGASDAAGVTSSGVASSVTKSAAVAAAVGLGTQSIALEGAHYLERRVHNAEQDAIASAAAPLVPGAVAPWSIKHSLPLEDDEKGQLVVSRMIGSGALLCKEIVFSVDTRKRRDFYVATVCRAGDSWKWASAEPAVARWGGLQ
jgi:hypothetical protein